MKFQLLLAAGSLCTGVVYAAPVSSAPSAKLASGDVISGGTANNTEFFKGIPYAQPPVGNLRFRPPVAFSGSLNGFVATDFGARCIQQGATGGDPYASLPESIQPILDEYFVTPPGGTYSEDCLTVSVYRPPGTKAGDMLPVMYWIYGGSFTGGYQDKYDPSIIVEQSASTGKPLIVVTMNYRLGVYGWLGGQQVLDEGPGNWGLLDQRLGMEWVADNIVGFGGDPSRVTIWGESAGSISVGHQLTLYNGDNTYKGKPLFSGAIMESGSMWNTKSINSTRPQLTFDALALAVGCEFAQDVLACMRQVPVQQMNIAQNNISIPLTFGPRYDYQALPQQPYDLIAQGKYAQVPYIIGDQTDEGTLFSLSLSFVSSFPVFDVLVEYLSPDSTLAEAAELTLLYPNIASLGSPFGTGSANELYSGYKRNSAYLGDFIFNFPRRYVLQHTSSAVNAWSYNCDAFRGTPYLGTFHGSDVGLVFYTADSPASNSMRNYWISFANSRNPNHSGDTQWPMYSQGQNLLNITATSNTLIPDTFRQTACNVINSNIQDFWN